MTNARDVPPMPVVHQSFISFISCATLIPSAIRSTNDDNIPQGWKNNCLEYNDKLFFESYDECCAKYFNGIDKAQCLKSDINDSSAADDDGDGCDHWHPSITDTDTW